MLSDYMENRLIDWLFRGQAFTPPANFYVALFTADPADSAAGTEVSYPEYARVAVAASLAAWAGTQSDGSTTASSGSSGTTSNNAAVTFPTPADDVVAPVTHWGLFDASSGGNRILEGVITNAAGTPSPKTLTGGDAVVFPIAALRINVDV